MTNIDKLVRLGFAFDLGYVPENVRTKECKKAWHVCSSNRGFGSGQDYFGDTADEACGEMLKACIASAKESLTRIQALHRETVDKLQKKLEQYAELES